MTKPELIKIYGPALRGVPQCVFISFYRPKYTRKAKKLLTVEWGPLGCLDDLEESNSFYELIAETEMNEIIDTWFVERVNPYRPKLTSKTGVNYGGARGFCSYVPQELADELIGILTKCFKEAMFKMPQKMADSLDEPS